MVNTLQAATMFGFQDGNRIQEQVNQGVTAAAEWFAAPDANAQAASDYPFKRTFPTSRSDAGGELLVSAGPLTTHMCGIDKPLLFSQCGASRDDMWSRTHGERRS